MGVASQQAISRFELPGGLVRYQAECQIEWKRLERGVVWVRCIGRDDGVLAPYITQDWLEELRAVGRLHLFLDLREQKGMGLRARDAYMEFGKEARGRGGGFALVNNRMLDLSLAVIAMFVGSEVLASTMDPDVFESAIAKRVTDFGGLHTLT